MTIKFGEKIEHESGATRHNAQGKGRFDLIPFRSLQRVAIHYELGAFGDGESEGHGADNWKLGLPRDEMLSSAIRHLLQYNANQIDEDHGAAAVWNILGAMYFEDLPATDEEKSELAKIISEEIRKDQLLSEILKRVVSLLNPTINYKDIIHQELIDLLSEYDPSLLEDRK